MDIALYQPEIPPNTGNIIRLCANTHSTLHLIGPMSFEITEKSCRRAGLDYKEMACIIQHDTWDDFFHQNTQPLVALSTKGTKHYHAHAYAPNSILLFGPESRGLPAEILANPVIQTVRIPMAADSRSLNLSNTCAIVLYEALRQINFLHGKNLLS